MNALRPATPAAVALVALGVGLGHCSRREVLDSAAPIVTESVSAGVNATPAGGAAPLHSSPIATSADGAHVYVVNPDADSVSVVNTRTHTLEREVLLGESHPVFDAATQRFDPAVSPRSLALSNDGARVFVSGERSGRVYAIDAVNGTVSKSEVLCAEPAGVLLSPDGARLYVACSNDDEVVAVRTSDLAVDARVSCPRKPWSLAWGSDGALVATHLLGPGVSVFGTAPLALQHTFTIPDGPPGDDPRVPHGEVRGIYDAALRPGTNELWVLHMMLGTDTAQPHLDFERTVFPAITVLDPQGKVVARMTAHVRPNDTGAFGDVVSGPRAIAFTGDGRYAYMVDTDSEDVMSIDAVRRVEIGLVRPLPGHIPEGISLSNDSTLWLHERNTQDVVHLRANEGHTLAVDGTRTATVATDPMPEQLRLGQKLFYSANSDDAPITQDHWVACASCHLEGRSDAVTWGFAQGPRDTPSNAGGMRDTGFLFRTAARNRVQDYFQTINIEQGGAMSSISPAHRPLLDAIAAYVNGAIPTPVPPRTDAAMRARGEEVFAQVGCTHCHSGPALTDSGAGNPRLDLRGPIMLHDVGTCRHTGAFRDVANADKEGHARGACAFDTPALRGLADSAPYLHDGSAATLDDVLNGPTAHVGTGMRSVSSEDRRALVEFLRSL